MLFAADFSKVSARNQQGDSKGAAREQQGDGKKICVCGGQAAADYTDRAETRHYIHPGPNA